MVTNDQWTLTQTNTATGDAPTSLGIWDGTGHGTGTLAFTGGDLSGCIEAGGSGPREASVNLISGGATSLTASEPATCVRCPCRNRRVSCA